MPGRRSITILPLLRWASQERLTCRIAEPSIHLPVFANQQILTSYHRRRLRLCYLHEGGTMNPILIAVALISCLMALPTGFPAYADSTESVNPTVIGPATSERVVGGQLLATIVSSITPIPQETKMRRNIAQATFCLPQNILGALLYGFLQLTGSVVDTAELNEIKIVVATAPVGVSLGRYILLHQSLVTENIVRHEYGHTMQGYKRGPFFLLFEGLTSFVQAAVSLISHSFADGYFERWPENEANELGGVTQPVVSRD